MRLHNEEVGSFLDLWDITTDVLVVSVGSPAVKAAVHRLTNVLLLGRLTELNEELDDNGHQERKHMLTIINHLLKPLLGAGKVVLNRMEYSTIAQNIKTDFLGMGNEQTWHGAPDCRCDVVDIINLDNVPPGDEELSEAESSGSKTPIDQ